MMTRWCASGRWALARFGNDFTIRNAPTWMPGPCLGPAPFALIRERRQPGICSRQQRWHWLALQDPKLRLTSAGAQQRHRRAQPDAGPHAPWNGCRQIRVSGYVAQRSSASTARQGMQALGGATCSRWTGAPDTLGAFFAPRRCPSGRCRPTEATFSHVVGAAGCCQPPIPEQVGLMTEGLFPLLREIDWATRGARRFRLGFAPASVVLHKGASIGTLTASGGSPLSVCSVPKSAALLVALSSDLVCVLCTSACWMLRGCWCAAAGHRRRMALRGLR